MSQSHNFHYQPRSYLTKTALIFKGIQILTHVHCRAVTKCHKMSQNLPFLNKNFNFGKTFTVRKKNVHLFSEIKLKNWGKKVEQLFFNSFPETFFVKAWLCYQVIKIILHIFKRMKICANTLYNKYDYCSSKLKLILKTILTEFWTTIVIFICIITNFHLSEDIDSY